LLEVFDVYLFLSFFIAFWASALTAYVGFGGALIMVPLYTFLFGPINAIAITTMCSLVSLSPLVLKLIKNIEWAKLLPLSAGIIISNLLGIVFLTSADPTIVSLGMGLFVLVSGFILMSNFSYKGPRGSGISAFVGLICGSVMGGFGVPSGPILVVYFLAAPITVVTQRANILFPIWLMCLVTSVSLGGNGFLEQETYFRALFILPFSIGGAWLGSYIFKKAPVSWFKAVANCLLIVIGASLMLQHLIGFN
jgi:uncharacterized membrane protein YfcA